MGRYADNLKAKESEARLAALLEGESSDNKIGSLKEVLNMLGDTKDGDTKIEGVIDARISAALGEDGDITTAISSGASAAIAAAIGEGGDVETWADGRYTKKTE